MPQLRHRCRTHIIHTRRRNRNPLRGVRPARLCQFKHSSSTPVIISQLLPGRRSLVPLVHIPSVVEGVRRTQRLHRSGGQLPLHGRARRHGCGRTVCTGYVPWLPTRRPYLVWSGHALRGACGRAVQRPEYCATGEDILSTCDEKGSHV